MIPIGDDNRDRRTVPYITRGLITLNVIVFVFLQDFGRNVRFEYACSMVPAEILSGKDVVTPERIGIDRERA